MDKLKSGLEGLGRDGLSLMAYGSYIRGDCDYGRSDIDAVLTFPHEFVIDPEYYRKVEAAFADALKGDTSVMRAGFQVCPLDLGNARDGRFNSLTSDFLNYFMNEKNVLVGPDYIEQGEMTMFDLKTGNLSTLSHNLRKMRQSLLYSEHDRMQEDRGPFVNGFYSTLASVSRGSKQILQENDGEVRHNRFSALSELSSLFPDLDLTPLERIKYLFTHKYELFELYKEDKADQAIELWHDSIGFLEELIRLHIQANPHTILSSLRMGGLNHIVEKLRELDRLENEELSSEK
ncbi:MAG: hypothetical protein ABII01_01985 [Candidatus Woesearchaeota archaeon]